MQFFYFFGSFKLVGKDYTQYPYRSLHSGGTCGAMCWVFQSRPCFLVCVYTIVVHGSGVQSWRKETTVSSFRMGLQFLTFHTFPWLLLVKFQLLKVFLSSCSILWSDWLLWDVYNVIMCAIYHLYNNNIIIIIIIIINTS